MPEYVLELTVRRRGSEHEGYCSDPEDEEEIDDVQVVYRPIPPVLATSTKFDAHDVLQFERWEDSPEWDYIQDRLEEYGEYTTSCGCRLKYKILKIRKVLKRAQPQRENIAQQSDVFGCICL